MFSFSVVCMDRHTLRVTASETVGSDDLDFMRRRRRACREIKIRRPETLHLGKFRSGSSQRVEACGVIGVVELCALHGTAVATVLVPHHRPMRVPVPHLCDSAGGMFRHLTGPPQADLPGREFPEISVFPRKLPAAYGAQNEAYMSRSAEKWVRDLCFNELDVCG